jgi:hypothetical protein
MSLTVAITLPTAVEIAFTTLFQMVRTPSICTLLSAVDDTTDSSR